MSVHAHRTIYSNFIVTTESLEINFNCALNILSTGNSKGVYNLAAAHLLTVTASKRSKFLTRAEAACGVRLRQRRPVTDDVGSPAPHVSVNLRVLLPTSEPLYPPPLIWWNQCLV
uniref:Uncharacterized protein n=1 Tax=Setaria viridis TaxID=4556 RepID=A0A4U6VYV8_SETVI|nr:hypothetical protein SEVIR_2G358900v2 [Setaria viridis]